MLVEWPVRGLFEPYISLDRLQLTHNPKVNKQKLDKWMDGTHCQVQDTTLSFVTWRIILQEAASKRCVQCWHKMMDMVRINTLALAFMCSGGPTKYPHTITSPPSLCFRVVYANFWLHHPNNVAEIKTHQTQPHFSNYLLSSFATLYFLFLCDRSGLLLLYAICIKVWLIVCSVMLFCIPWL